MADKETIDPLLDRKTAAKYLDLKNHNTLAVWDCTKRYNSEPIKIGRNLRNQETMEGLDSYLVKRDIQHVKNYSNATNALLELHGLAIQQGLENGWINAYQQVEIDRTLTRLCDAVAKCERIKNTLFPVIYSLYIHFSLIVFFILLLFSLIEVFSVIFFIPVLIARATVFFLVEKMAIHLQDPYENKPTGTPMTAICFTIERDLNQVMNETPAGGAVSHPKAFIFYKTVAISCQVSAVSYQLSADQNLIGFLLIADG